MRISERGSYISGTAAGRIKIIHSVIPAYLSLPGE
jgi:hypothetical protein